MAREEKVVLDASVVTKWYTKEKDSEAAIEYKDMHVSGKLTIFEPSLLIYEVTNALNYNPNFSESDVKESIASLIDLDLKIIEPSKEMIAKIVSLARNYGTSIYDSSYLALGSMLDVNIITADSRFWEKIKNDPHVQLLESK